MLKILLVEDNRTDQLIFKKAIESTGIDCELSILDHADQIVQEVEKLQPQMIFMDIMMSGVSGVHAAKLLKNHKNKIPLVFITVIFELNSDLSEDKGIDVEGQNFPALAKPIKIDKLKTMILKYTS